MVPLLTLWLPIVVSAVLVFIVSPLVHMVLGYHKSDLAPLPAEGEIMTALRRHDLAPGAYAHGLGTWQDSIWYGQKWTNGGEEHAGRAHLSAGDGRGVRLALVGRLTGRLGSGGLAVELPLRALPLRHPLLDLPLEL